MTRVILAAIVLALLVAPTVRAQQTPSAVFSTLDSVAADRAASSLAAAPAGVADRQLVGMHLDRLFDSGADRVLLNVDGHDWVAAFTRLEPDVLGHRAWVGTIEGIDYSSVVFSERDAVVSGAIDAVSTKYQISTVSPGVYTLDRVQHVKTESESTDDAIVAPARESKALAAVTASDTAAFIDVLILWTPAARASSTVAAMQALAAQIVTQSNQAYANSGVTTRLRLAGASELAYTEAVTMGDPGDLANLRTNPTVAVTRDSVAADLVQLLVRSNDSPCGVGYLLNGNAVYGVSVADIVCVSQYTPTHEMGHNQGSHHAPEDGASGGYFSYSYGYKDPIRAFRTIMAYECSGSSCPRTLNLSNPAVNHASGFPTGTANQNNALSINNTALTVANFRQSAPATLPSAPAGLTSQVSGLNVALAWGAAAAATGYVLQVGSAPGVYNLLTYPLGNVTSISGSAPAGIYYWRVYGTNSVGNGPPSAEAQFTLGGCTPASAPQNFAFSVGAGRVVNLSWSAPASGAAPFSYIIDAGTGPGLANILSAPVGGITALSVVAPPGTYFVRVRAANACTPTSPPSNEQVIVVP